MSNISAKLSGFGGGHASLSDFTGVCVALRNSLNHLTRCVAKSESEFPITDLSVSSAYIACTPSPELVGVATVFRETVSRIQSGRDVDERLDYSAIQSFKAFCAPIRKNLPLSLSGVSINSAYVENIDELLRSSVPSLGSVKGRLLGLDIHIENNNRFVLYPPIPGAEVICKFEAPDLSEVIKAVGKIVTVHGTLHYSRASAFPTRVYVREFTVEPESSKIPSLTNARGIMTEEPRRGSDDEWK